MAMTFDLVIYIDGQDEPVTVRADQRDMAAFERQYKVGTSRAVEEMTMVFFRYIGYQALRRTGKTEARFDDWDENVVSVEPAGDDEDPNPTSAEA